MNQKVKILFTPNSRIHLNICVLFLCCVIISCARNFTPPGLSEEYLSRDAIKNMPHTVYRKALVDMGFCQSIAKYLKYTDEEARLATIHSWLIVARYFEGDNIEAAYALLLIPETMTSKAKIKEKWS